VNFHELYRHKNYSGNFPAPQVIGQNIANYKVFFLRDLNPQYYDNQLPASRKPLSHLYVILGSFTMSFFVIFSVILMIPVIFLCQTDQNVYNLVFWSLCL
jgi:hypothetical protein